MLAKIKVGEARALSQEECERFLRKLKEESIPELANTPQNRGSPCSGHEIAFRRAGGAG